ncbi:hypothetical protein L6R50_08965 [Myxococcota bacterium]|nr:hypothetical protein [Myxococcota bacterium]
MIRDDAQRGRVCETILRVARIDTRDGLALWSEGRPTDVFWWELRRGAMSHGERLMLRLAAYIWNDANKAPDLGDCLRVLDGANLRARGTLVTALAGHAADVDGWIGEWGTPRRERSGGGVP